MAARSSPVVAPRAAASSFLDDVTGGHPPGERGDRLIFPAALRVRAKRDFEAVYRTGKRIGDAFFSINLCANKVNLPRLGLSVGTKAIGNAIARNRVRRLIRESFRHARPGLRPLDYVVGAKSAARQASATTLRASLETLWTRTRL